MFFTAGAETVFGAEVVCLLMRTILFAGAEEDTLGGAEILGAGAGVEILGAGAGVEILGELNDGLELGRKEEVDRKDEPELKEEDERKEDELLAPKLFA